MDYFVSVLGNRDGTFQSDNINWMMTSSVITLSGFHCNKIHHLKLVTLTMNIVFAFDTSLSRKLSTNKTFGLRQTFVRILLYYYYYHWMFQRNIHFNRILFKMPISNCLYSQTCMQRPPLVPQKTGHCS